MVHRVYEMFLKVPVEKVWEFHSSAEALNALTPPGKHLRVLSSDLAVRNGALHELESQQFGMRLVWAARISDVTPPFGFTDTAEKSPFAFWQHRHEFRPEGNGTRLVDTLTYALPFGPLGQLADWLFVRRQVDSLFAFRHAATKNELERNLN